MCWKCELRRLARSDNEAAATLDALENDTLSRIWPILLGEAMKANDMTELKVSVGDVDTDEYAGVMIARNDDEWTVHLVRPDELEGVLADVELHNHQPTVN